MLRTTDSAMLIPRKKLVQNSPQLDAVKPWIDEILWDELPVPRQAAPRPPASGWTRRSPVPASAGAIVGRLTFGATIIETGTVRSS